MIIKPSPLLQGPSCSDTQANFHSAHTHYLDKTHEDEELSGWVGTWKGVCHRALLLYFWDINFSCCFKRLCFAKPVAVSREARKLRWDMKWWQTMCRESHPFFFFFSAVITFTEWCNFCLISCCVPWKEKRKKSTVDYLHCIPKKRARRHGNKSRWKCSQTGSRGGGGGGGLQSISQGWEADQWSHSSVSWGNREVALRWWCWCWVHFTLPASIIDSVNIVIQSEGGLFGVCVCVCVCLCVTEGTSCLKCDSGSFVLPWYTDGEVEGAHAGAKTSQQTADQGSRVNKQVTYYTYTYSRYR